MRAEADGARCENRRRLLFSRAQERREGEIEKDNHERGRGDEGAVVGAVDTCGVGSPGHRREGQNKQKKKHAGHFKPDDSADAAKWAKKASHAPCHAARNLARRTAGCFLVGWIQLRGPGRGRLSRCSRVRLTGKLLFRHASSKAKANSRNAANLFRLHFDSMVTAQQGHLPGPPFAARPEFAPWFTQNPPSGELPAGNLGIKVDESDARAGAFLRARLEV